MEQLMTAGPWGAIGGLIFVVIMLLKQRKGATDACPIAYGGGTPMTKEHHDEVCNAKWIINDARLNHITDTVNRVEKKVDALPNKLNGGTKK